MIDFLASNLVTNKVQFYKELDGQSKPEGGGCFPPHEVDKDQAIQTVEYVVYPHGSSVTIEVKFYNPLSYQVSGTWSFEEATFDLGGGPSNLSKSQADTTITLLSHQSVTKTAYVDLPNDGVQMGSLHVSFKVTCGAYVGTGAYTGTLFMTDVAPDGLMSTPWTEVLGYACAWAEGDTGKDDCLEDCTRGLFNSDLFDYSESRCYHIVDTLYDEEENSADNGKFDLSALFGDNPNGSSADCRDTSPFLLLCTSSIGYSGSLRQLYAANPTFHTNDIMAIGIGHTGASSTLFGPTNWDYHQVFDDSGSVYDACLALKLDLSGSDYRDVPFNWAKADYWQKHVGNYYYGLVSCLTGHSPETVEKQEQAAELNGPFGHGVTLLQGIR